LSANAPANGDKSTRGTVPASKTRANWSPEPDVVSTVKPATNVKRLDANSDMNFPSNNTYKFDEVVVISILLYN
jgi:hypothetical protein